MVSRPPRRSAGPSNDSRANGPPAPASAAATAPGFVDGKPQPSFYDAGGGYEAEGYHPDDDLQGSPLQHAAFVNTVREAALPIESGGSADVDVVERMAADEDTQEGETLEEAIARIRQFRKPLGEYTQKLALPQRRGYHRHWFNDVAGRIDEAKANGWTHVRDAEGKPIARCVGSGRDKGAMFGFAMEIPEVFWREDMAARHAGAQAKIDALKSSPFRAPAGTAQATDKGKFYDPTEHDAGPLQVVRAGS